MSFLRQTQIYPPIGSLVDTGDGPLYGFAPGLIVWMSLPPAIPWQVALPQSLPPLRRVTMSMRYSGLSVQIFSSNGKQCLNCLCQPRGQAQSHPACLTLSLPTWRGHSCLPCRDSSRHLLAVVSLCRKE